MQRRGQGRAISRTLRHMTTTAWSARQDSMANQALGAPTSTKWVLQLPPLSLIPLIRIPCLCLSLNKLDPLLMSVHSHLSPFAFTSIMTCQPPFLSSPRLPLMPPPFPPPCSILAHLSLTTCVKPRLSPSPVIITCYLLHLIAHRSPLYVCHTCRSHFHVTFSCHTFISHPHVSVVLLAPHLVFLTWSRSPVTPYLSHLTPGSHCPLLPCRLQLPFCSCPLQLPSTAALCSSLPQLPSAASASSLSVVLLCMLLLQCAHVAEHLQETTESAAHVMAKLQTTPAACCRPITCESTVPPKASVKLPLTEGCNRNMLRREYVIRSSLWEVGALLVQSSSEFLDTCLD